MRHIYTALVATTAIALASSVYASEVKNKVEYDNDGGYESSRTSTQTDAAGTHKSTEASVDVDVDSDGKISKTITKENKTDPKGLLNQKKEVSETEIEEKERGGYKQTTTSKHIDADGTNTTLVTTTNVDVDKNGNVTTTAETKKTVDPVGMLNSKTSTTTSKTVNGKVVESSRKTTK